ncbi:MAG: 8-oxo-dGTP diphosphatase MutT [Gammaproteobacteria bacterium]|nr:8-oxo-dGTP diphosphatase MutT [Gammaproteobacteria bacterium]
MALQVVVGIIQNAQGEYLLALRPTGKPLAGFWEFPGGKIEKTETAYQALCRELTEELGIAVTQAELLCEYVYDAQKVIFFSVWQVKAYEGQPKPLAADKLKWSGKMSLAQHVFPPPNRAILQQLGVPLCGC